nr:hypothetical protein [Russula sp.]
MTKYQNYSHYKLPITINPLNYGKLIDQIGNKYIIQLNTTNVVIIIQKEIGNYIKFFRKGELMFEFNDVKKSDISFVRTIANKRYTFEQNKLISTEILSTASCIKIYEDTDAFLTKNTPFNMESFIKFLESTNIYKNKKAELFILFELFLIFLVFIIFFIIFPETNENTALAAFSSKNIIKLRKTRSIHSWNTIEFKIENLLFTTELFKSKFNLFWDQVYPGFSNNNHMFILFKIKFKTIIKKGVIFMKIINNVYKLNFIKRMKKITLFWT